MMIKILILIYPRNIDIKIAAIAGSGVAANNPNQIVNGDGGRGMFIIKGYQEKSKFFHTAF